MLKPLKQWICDSCGEVIKEPREGWVEWISDIGSHKVSGFKIVHHSPFAPRGEGKCYHYTNHRDRQDMHLNDVIDGNSMVYLLSFLDVGPHHEPEYGGPRVQDMREFVEFARRLTLPYYEEARFYWSKAKEEGLFDDANEIWLYLPQTSEEIVRKYGEKST